MPVFKAVAPFPVCLASGRILAAGERADLDDAEVAANADLIDGGQLAPLVTEPPADAEPAKAKRTTKPVATSEES